MLESTVVLWKSVHPEGAEDIAGFVPPLRLPTNTATNKSPSTVPDGLDITVVELFAHAADAIDW